MYTNVEVTITNPEFGEISTREVELAKYLDMLQTVETTNADHIDKVLSFEQIAQIGDIDVQAARNVQEVKTSLELNEADVLKLEWLIASSRFILLGLKGSSIFILNLSI